MKEFKNLKIIGVDHGYGNIKTAGTVTKNGVTDYETEPIFSGNILEYGGCTIGSETATRNLSQTKLRMRTITCSR